MKELKDIERSIQKKYRKEIFSKFVRAINEFNLIEENDKIAICISGGKDSFLLAKCMQELKRHNKFHYELVFMVMNPGYSEEKLQAIIDNAKYLNIPITIFDTNIFEVIKEPKILFKVVCISATITSLYIILPLLCGHIQKSFEKIYKENTEFIQTGLKFNRIMMLFMDFLSK